MIGRKMGWRLERKGVTINANETKRWKVSLRLIIQTFVSALFLQGKSLKNIFKSHKLLIIDTDPIQGPAHAPNSTQLLPPSETYPLPKRVILTRKLPSIP